MEQNWHTPKGLLFTGPAGSSNTNGKFRINYNDGRFELNGSGDVVTIKNLKAGSTITVSCKTSSSSTARGLNVTNITPVSGSFNSTSTDAPDQCRNCHRKWRCDDDHDELVCMSIASRWKVPVLVAILVGQRPIALFRRIWRKIRCAWHWIQTISYITIRLLCRVWMSITTM